MYRVAGSRRALSLDEVRQTWLRGERTEEIEFKVLVTDIREEPTALYYVLTLLNPTGHVMHHQFNIQQLYALPTLYLCVLYLSENKQRLVPLTA